MNYASIGQDPLMKSTSKRQDPLMTYASRGQDPSMSYALAARSCADRIKQSYRGEEWTERHKS
jgi:hypothetical protein